jgi:hypothetical protein
MKLTPIDPPGRSFSRWLTDEEVGRVLAHSRGWRLGSDGSVVAGSLRKTTIAPSLSALGQAAATHRWISRPAAAASDGSGPTHVMWGIFDARPDAEVAELVAAAAH